MPPLRDRAEDVPLLADRFLREFAAQNGKAIAGITPEALEVLAAHAWPGNVRELRNAVERMVVLARGDRLTLRDVPPAIREAVGGPRAAGAGARAAGAAGLSLAEAERAMIVRALERTGGNRVQAARDLGISRRTLHRRLHELGLRERFRRRRDPAAPPAG
jgi:two-component system response regulator HydG